MDTSTNVKTNFLMPDSNVTVTANWAHQYLGINADGSIGANATLKALTADTPVDLVIPSEINGIKVTRIGIRAFANCKSLTSVTIPNSVTTIDEVAFHGCNSLTSITIPNSVTDIREHAFAYCSGLTSITIPDTVTSISDHVFHECTSLTSFTIPDTVTSIGDYAFFSCESLPSITIPEGVTSIGEGAFIGCTVLNTINIDKPQDSITGSPWDAPRATVYWNNRVYFNVSDGEVSASDALKALTADTPIDLVIPSEVDGTEVTSIGNGAFNGSVALRSITIPNSVTSIGNNAFYGCTSLTSVIIPEGVESIGFQSFAGCTSLTSIDIPSSVTSIHASAFNGCTALTTINVDNLAFIIEYYPWSAPNATVNWKRASDPKYFQVTSSGLVSASTTLKNMSDGSISHMVIPSEINGYKVTGISASGFQNCRAFVKCIIPNGVTSIGNSAFSGCSILGYLYIPNSVTSIGTNALANCATGSMLAVDLDNTYNAISGSPWGANNIALNPLR